jgi:hypothetical protein
MTGLPFPIYPTAFEALLHPDPLPWSLKDSIYPMNRICIDNTPLSPLGKISRETWVKTSNFLGDENAFPPSDYVRIFTVLITWLVKLIMLHRTSNIMRPHTLTKTDAVLRLALTVSKTLMQAMTVEVAIILKGTTRRDTQILCQSHFTKHDPLTTLATLKGALRNLVVL